jgi:hypothetical protein
MRAIYQRRQRALGLYLLFCFRSMQLLGPFCFALKWWQRKRRMSQKLASQCLPQTRSTVVAPCTSLRMQKESQDQKVSEKHTHSQRTVLSRIKHSRKKTSMMNDCHKIRRLFAQVASRDSEASLLLSYWSLLVSVTELYSSV